MLAAVLVAACGGGATTASRTGSSTAASSSSSEATASSPAEAVPTLAISPADGAGDVRLDAPVSVTSDSGALDKVVLHSDADQTPLPGSLSTNKRTWTVSEPLDPGSHYVLQASAHDLGGTSTISAGFTTMRAPDKLTTDVVPGDGATVGVGMPVILKFDAPVDTDKQTNVVNHIEVKTSTPVTGAWHWFGNQEVHFRTQDYWPSGTQVQINAHLRGVEVGGGVWGLGDWQSSFTVGPKHVSIIDAAAHQMQVFSNDALVHTYPVSTGKLASPTISGTLFVWYKLQKVRMVSTSIGIPVNAPGGYDEDVFWDTAISTDGFYIHSAPWSVWAQGSTNVSHGCVNLSEARAIEFFNFSQVGDIVQVKNTARTADYSDGEADWQIPFEQYANSGGAVQTPAAAAAPTQGGGL